MTRLFAGIVGCVIALSITAAIADDSTIAEQLSSDLRLAKQSKELQDFRINVKVEDGVVWMTGSVNDATQKSKALDVARRVSGVRLVVNDLEIEGEARERNETANTNIAASASANEVTAASANMAANATIPNAQAIANAVATSRGNTASSLGGVGAIGNAAATNAGVMQAAAQLQAAKMQTAKLQMEAAQLQIARNRLLQTQIAAQRATLTQQAQGNQLVNYCADGGCAVGGGYDSYGGGIAGGSYGGDYGSYGGASNGGSGYETYGGSMGGGGAQYESAQMPGYAWPSYAASPNYAALSYPKQYSAQAWPYIGPFYPYPQVPLGWRKVSLEWDDGWWMLDFSSK